MSHVVSTYAAPFCRVQDHPGSVSVSVLDQSAEQTHEGSFLECDAFLGSRTAGTTSHAGVGGRNQHHLSARPSTTFDQFPLRRSDGSICRLPGHRGPSDDLQFEVLDSNERVTVHDLLRPSPRILLVLTARPLLKSRGLKPDGEITPGRWLRLRPLPPRHLPLDARQLRGAASPMPKVGEIELRVSGCGRGGDAPVNSDPAISGGSGPRLTSHDERHVPVPKAVAKHLACRRLGRKVAGPHHRDDSSLGQAQATVLHREAVAGEWDRGKCRSRATMTRKALPLDLPRMEDRLYVVIKRCGLRVLPPASKPRVRLPGLSEELPKMPLRDLNTGALLVDCLVPQPATPAPLGEKRSLRLAAGPQPVVVPQDLGGHSASSSAESGTTAATRRPRFVMNVTCPRTAAFSTSASRSRNSRTLTSASSATTPVYTHVHEDARTWLP